MATTRPRRSTSQGRKADAIFGYAIPAFFVMLAGYQQITTGQIDKYVLGILAVFGLSALGWRLDLFFDSWVRARYGNVPPPPQSPSGKEQ